MTIRLTMGRGQIAALLACSLFTSVFPISAFAEYGIPAGSGAVVTTGTPLTVRIAPGWDTEVSYEIADGSYVTVWAEAQAAPDGSLWYPVDGGFVPVDAVTSTATPEGGFALYQTAETSEETWTEPAQGWIDPATGLWVDPNVAAPVAEETWTEPVEQEAQVSEGWVDPNTGLWVEPSAQGWVDPATGAWVEPGAEGWIDPATGLWVDATTTATDVYTEPAPEATGWIDPNTGLWVDAATVETAVEPVVEAWVDPATGQSVDATAPTSAPATDGWIDAATGQWVAASAEGWIDPNTGLWVDPNAVAPQDGVALYQEAVDPNAVPVDMAVVPDTTETWTEAPVAEVPVTEGWDAPVQDPAAMPSDVVPVVEDTWTEPVATDYVAEAPVTDQWVEPAPVDTSSSDSWSEPIGTAYIAGSNGDGAACRVSAERGSDKIAVLGEGEAVEVRGEAIGEWQPVNCAGMGGYVNTAFISWEPVATGGGRKNRTNSVGDGGTVTSNGDGQSMVNFAMQYVGYPYAYAGEGPYAFDCSGFTKFVAMNALGIDITHDMFTQIGMGQSVDQGSLQPGDLVFFANTFRPGLSHVGIYIGGGQFVHSENESTGVVVSDLNSDYYGSRWAGGTRLA